MAAARTTQTKAMADICMLLSAKPPSVALRNANCLTNQLYDYIAKQANKETTDDEYGWDYEAVYVKMSMNDAEDEYGKKYECIWAQYVWCLLSCHSSCWILHVNSIHFVYAKQWHWSDYWKEASFH